MRESQPYRVRLVVALNWVVIAIAAVVLIFFLAHVILTTTIPFDNDEANHALDGWEVYHALARLSPGQLFKAVTNQAFYPPIHSFLVAGWYLLAGPGVATSRMPGVVSFTLVVFGLAWLTFRIAQQGSGQNSSGDTWLPFAGAGFAAALVITSPILVHNAILCMLEMTGAVLAILLLLIAQQGEWTAEARHRCVGVLLTAFTVMVLFLTKYSFGLFYGPGVVVALLTVSWPWRASRGSWLEAIMVVAIYGAIFAIWMLLTQRQAMVMFFTEHPQYVPFWSAVNLFYLPMVWLVGYSTRMVIGLMACGLAVVGTIYYWKQLPVRIAFWSVVTGVLVLTISTTNEPRHMLVLAPAIWMLAGLGVARVLYWLQRHPQGSTRVVLAVLFILCVLVIGAIRPAGRLHQDLLKELEGLPVYDEIQQFALAHVELARPILVVGELNDQNSLLAIRWRAAVLSNKSSWELDIDYFPFAHREASLRRTNRKPQIATVDPNFPRESLSEILTRGHYAYVIEMGRVNEESRTVYERLHELLRSYPAVSQLFGDWRVTVYELASVKE